MPYIKCDVLLKIYLSFVNLAIKIFESIPKAIIKAVVVPNSFNASPTIASLLGTIPVIPNPYSNIFPK